MDDKGVYKEKTRKNSLEGKTRVSLFSLTRA